MAKFPLYQWKKVGGSSTVDTSNLAKLNANNTFTGKNTFESTANVVSIKSTDDQAFGIEFERNTGQRVGYIGTSPDDGTTKTTVWGINGLILKTSNNTINMSPGNGHVISTSSLNWNNYVDNEVVRQKDTKWYRIIDYTNVPSNARPAATWNRSSWNWTLSNLNTNQGIYEILFCISFNDDKTVTIRGDIVWKTGLTESRSQVMVVEKNERIYYFQFVINSNDKLYCYTKHDNQGTGADISWVRGWVKRGITYPSKTNQLW